MSVPGPTPADPQPESTPYPPAQQPYGGQAPYDGAGYPGQAPYGGPAPQAPYPGQVPYAGQAPYAAAAPIGYASRKNLLVASLLCFFLGAFGVHRFYVGKVGTGILQLVTVGGLGIWTLIDFIMLVCQAFKDSDGYPLRWDTVH